MTLGLIGKPHLDFVLFLIGITQHLIQHQANKYRRDHMRATVCIVACVPPTASGLLRGAG